MATLVTVVIPTRNRLELLQQAVASVQAQVGVEWRLVVVDDASDDGTSEWLASLDDDRVRSIRLSEHRERSAARNRGLEEAEGTGVLFLDDDDRLRPHALATLEAGLRRHTRAVTAVGAFEAFDARGHRRRSAHPRRTHVREVLPEAVFGWLGAVPATMFRIGPLLDSGAWDERLTHGEDQELTLRMATLGPSVIVPDIVVDVRREAAAQRRPPDTYARELQLREHFLGGLDGPQLVEAERALDARVRYFEALAAWERNEGAPALRSMTGLVRRSANLACSPLVGPRIRSLLIRSIARTLIGRRLTARVQRIVWAVRHRLGRAPEGTAVMLPTDRSDTANDRDPSG